MRSFSRSQSRAGATPGNLTDEATLMKRFSASRHQGKRFVGGDGFILHRGECSGLQKPGDPTSVSTRTLFLQASIAKLFVATARMHLGGRGLLDPGNAPQCGRAHLRDQSLELIRRGAENRGRNERSGCRDSSKCKDSASACGGRPRVGFTSTAEHGMTRPGAFDVGLGGLFVVEIDSLRFANR